MRFPLWLVPVLLVSLLVALSWPADQVQIREQIRQNKIVLGQSPREVRAAIGEPTKITRTQTDWETTEDWVYGEGKDAISFIFQKGRLRRITEGNRSLVD